MKTQNKSRLEGILLKHGYNFEALPYSGYELKRFKWPGVDHTGILLGQDSDGRVWVAENSPEGPRVVPWHIYAHDYQVQAIRPLLGPAASVDRALRLKELMNYRFATANCQHYSNLAAHGRKKSSAVKKTAWFLALSGMVYAARRRM